MDASTAAATIGAVVFCALLIAFGVLVLCRGDGVLFPETRSRSSDAERRARELLFTHLRPDQRAEYEEQSIVTVVGESGNCYYLSPADIVVRLKQGGVYRMCIVPRIRDPVPADDVLLAKKLLIEADEQTFLATATRWPWLSW